MVEEVKKIDWNKYLDSKTGITVWVVLSAVGMAYLGKMDQSLSLVLSAAIASFNWFGGK